MSRLLVMLACCLMGGCLSKTPNPTPAAFRYPDESLAGLTKISSLHYEGCTIGLDGGSHVYILSTPEKKKIALWNRCLAVKLQCGYDPAKNAFMVETGEHRDDEHIVEHGSHLEALLIHKLAAAHLSPEKFPGQHQREAEIIDGLRDRSHAITF
jgi:hypothetical protein